MTPQLASTILRLCGWGFIIFGVLFVTISFPNFDAIGHYIADLFDWTPGPHDEVLTRDARWFGAIMAGVCAGLGGIFAFVVAPLLTLPNEAARNLAKRGGLISICIWFVIDSVGSIAAGVPSNAVLNAIFFLAITVPLLTVKFPVGAD